MQKIFKVLTLVCSSLICISCTHNANPIPTTRHLDFKNEEPAETFCINPSNPYAVVGSGSGLPPLSSVPDVIGQPLSITKGGV